jgi:hypothetical protein
MSKPDLSPLHNEVESTKGVIASAIALINGIAAKLREALAGDDVSGEVSAIAAELEAAKTALAEAVAANSPAEAPAVAE